jgi:hypothetical protein
MKVVVGGCSVSDYTEVKQVYGEILAENIGADYIHHGACCGSNYRIWRNITNLVMNNEITEDDLILIQYTEPTRQEFWSAYVDEHRRDIRDSKYNGDIVRWKFNAHKWHNTNDFEHKFLKLKEEHFTSTEFDLERFEYNHYLFHNTIVSKNIKIAYVVPNGHMKGHGWIFRDRFNKNGEIHITEDLTFDSLLYLLDDRCHFNQLGHKYVATTIEKFLKKKQWI